MLRRIRFYWRHRDYWRVVLDDAVERYRRWLFGPQDPPFAF